MSANTLKPVASDTDNASNTRIPKKPRKRPRARFTRKEKFWTLWISLILLPIAIIWIYPYIWTISASVKNTTEIFSSLNPFTSTLRLGNYIAAWQQANIGQYFLNTVFVTVVSIVISVVTAALMGYAMGRYQFPGKKVILSVFALAIFLPEGYTVIPTFDLISKLGLSGSLWGVALAEAGGVSIVTVLLYMGFFSQLPKELEESARIDGAGFFRTFAQVYLPLVKPVTATAIILQFMHSWNDFLLPLVLTLTSPELRTLSVGIYALRGQYGSEWGVMAAAATIAMLPIIVLFLFLQRYFVDSIAGAVKG